MDGVAGGKEEQEMLEWTRARTIEAPRRQAPRQASAAAVQAAPVPEALLVELPVFRGSYDGLLDYVRRQEISILDVPIAVITATYLSLTADLETLDLEVGGEWIELTGMMVLLKSRELLPPAIEDEEEDPSDGPDPQQELLARLREYKRFRTAAQALQEMPQLTRDVFTRPVHAELAELDTGPRPLQEASLVDLMGAIRELVEKRQHEASFFMEVTPEKLSLRSMIIDIAQRLARTPRLPFEELFEDQPLTRYRVVTTFMALLEMTRLRMIKLMQAKLDDGRLYLERAVIDIIEVSQELDLPED